MAYHVGKLDWFCRKYVAPNMFTSSLKEKSKKVCSENDIIFIEKDDTHILSEHALSKKSNDSELINTISVRTSLKLSMIYNTICFL